MKELLPLRARDYQERARAVAETAVRPVAAALDRSGEYPWSVVAALREAELMGIWVPPQYGGQGAGVLELCVVVEELPGLRRRGRGLRGQRLGELPHHPRRHRGAEAPLAAGGGLG